MVLPFGQLITFSAVFVVCCFAFAADEEVSVWSRALGLAFFGFGQIYAIRAFMRVEALSEGHIQVSRLLGRRKTLVHPKVEAVRESPRGYLCVNLVAGDQKSQLLLRIFSTQRRNMRLAKRIAETLRLEQHASVRAWLEADSIV